MKTRILKQGFGSKETVYLPQYRKSYYRFVVDDIDTLDKITPFIILNLLLFWFLIPIWFLNRWKLIENHPEFFKTPYKWQVEYLEKTEIELAKKVIDWFLKAEEMKKTEAKEKKKQEKLDSKTEIIKYP